MDENTTSQLGNEEVASAPEAQTNTAHREVDARTPSSPGILILQWLTYAFWGWTAVSLWVLSAITLAYFILDDGSSQSIDETIAYPLAAVMVLFITALVCDIFYSRKEPLRKEKAATVIMVIHAVIFALFGIGAIIVAVFSLVGMLISGEVDGPLVVLGTALIAALMYAALLLRTLRPRKLGKISVRGAWGVLAAVAIAMIVLSIAGPVVKSVQLRDDRLIEQNLTSVSSAIGDYARDNNKLPDSLNELKLRNDEAEQLVERNLIEYTKEQTPLTKSNLELGSSSYTPPRSSLRTQYYYTLCVEYKAEKNLRDNSYYSSGYDDSSRRSSSPSTYRHDEGRVCYKLQTSSYDRFDSDEL